MPDGPWLGAVVLHVRDLDRSIRFYEGLLGFEATLREPEAALLEGSSGSHMYLRVMRQGVRTSVGVGVHYTIWTFTSEDEFEKAGRWLDERGTEVRRHQYGEWKAVEGRDPDNLSVMVAYPEWQRVHPGEIFSGIFYY